MPGQIPCVHRSHPRQSCRRDETQPRFQSQQDAWHQAKLLAGQSRDGLRRSGVTAGTLGPGVRPAYPAHLDDSVSFSDPAVFGCNAVGIHLQGTHILGT